MLIAAVGTYALTAALFIKMWRAMKQNITLEQALSKASNWLQKKMMYSIDLLRKAERLALAYGGDKGYYLAFSGGKDSQALYHTF